MSALESRVESLSKRLLGYPVFLTGSLLLLSLMYAMVSLAGPQEATDTSVTDGSSRRPSEPSPLLWFVGVSVLLPVLVLLLKTRAKRIAEHDREKIRLKNMRAALGLPSSQPPAQTRRSP